MQLQQGSFLIWAYHQSGVGDAARLPDGAKAILAQSDGRMAGGRGRGNARTARPTPEKLPLHSAAPPPCAQPRSHNARHASGPPMTAAALPRQGGGMEGFGGVFGSRSARHAAAARARETPPASCCWQSARASGQRRMYKGVGRPSRAAPRRANTPGEARLQHHWRRPRELAS